MNAAGCGPDKEGTVCGGGGAAAAVRWPEVRGRASAERTEKILYISVTLERSRLNGWLNSYADCGVARDERAHVLRGARASEGVTGRTVGTRG